QLEFVDIAGLVRGASKGEGLGNKFLSHIREVDAILHVVRCFENAGGEEITHVEGSVDPIRDIDTIETELMLADLQSIEGSLSKAERAAKSGKKDEVARFEVLKKLQPVLAEGKPVRGIVAALTDPEEKKIAKSLGMLSSKPVLYVANVDESDVLGEGKHAQRVRERAAEEGMQVVPVCAKIEAELADLPAADRDELLASLGMKEPALAALARSAYKLLGLQSYYTAGEKEVRAWTVPVGATAPQAAGVIHTDFEKGFIRADVYSIADLEKLGSEKAIKDAGKMRSEGKNYLMHDADICHFHFNT
ncbi:MAG: redox-regulated ATPase YchF, partial [Phycisphaerales bacterium]